MLEQKNSQSDQKEGLAENCSPWQSGKTGNITDNKWKAEQAAATHSNCVGAEELSPSHLLSVFAVACKH